MAYRNMKKTANILNGQYAKNPCLTYYDLNMDEMTELYEMCLDNKQIEAFTLAFKYGFVLGTRAYSRKRCPML